MPIVKPVNAQVYCVLTKSTVYSLSIKVVNLILTDIKKSNNYVLNPSISNSLYYSLCTLPKPYYTENRHI